METIRASNQSRSSWSLQRNKFKLKRLQSKLKQHYSTEELLKLLVSEGCCDPHDVILKMNEAKKVRNEQISFNILNREVYVNNSMRKLNGLALQAFPGIVIFPNSIHKGLASFLSCRCVSHYCKPPHKTNQMNENLESSKKPPKLAWASLGYTFDWTNRSYSNENRSPFPEELDIVSKAFVGVDFIGETAIVNYYRPGSTMGPHLDDCERTFAEPVVSFSLGFSCVFLMGGRTKEEGCIPILLRHGDVMLMGGESRLAFHGVGCVLPLSLPPSFFPPFQLGLEWLRENKVSCTEEPIIEASALENLRININVRQVNVVPTS